jgi:hypothetical protein
MVDHATVQPSPIEESVLTDLGDRAPDAALERYKAHLAVWVAQETVYPPKMAELLGGFAQTGLRSLYLVNGGGLVAILALLGNVWGKGDVGGLANRLEPAARHLAWGLFVAFLATGAAYLSQLSFIDFRLKSWGFAAGRVGQAVCLLLCLLSLALFGWGTLSGIAAVGKRVPLHAAAWSTTQRSSL